MRQTWRWFGPDDPVSVRDAGQAGAEGLVCALYHIPPGQPWLPDAIAQRQDEARRAPDGTPSGLEWEVVESIPVSEAIKTQTGDWQAHIAAWKQSLVNLAEAGLEVVCYNFMPILDWTRTEHFYPLPHGGTAMAFDLTQFAAFDVHLLKRAGAEADYDAETLQAAAALVDSFDSEAKMRLTHNIIAGLPGSVETWTIDNFTRQLAVYAGMTDETLRRHLFAFLEEVVPVAERLGLRLCAHPDDPPFRLLGLPKVISTAEDYGQLLDHIPSPANGMTFCSGSLGSRRDNDVVAIARRFADRIHFAHLRNVTNWRDQPPNGFLEDNHLDGDVDMVAVLDVLMGEQRRRRTSGRSDWQIPMRPDHGHELLNDVERRSRAGYPAIGRLKGLAELRGVMRALGDIPTGRGFLD
ncbi:MAG: mannonate dehydratase [Pelagibacterium sp. SCN 64-44]|nr:MAG: mannonate dehydratase [Pelagibacterium sp. SCN 64-44]